MWGEFAVCDDGGVGFEVEEGAAAEAGALAGGDEVCECEAVSDEGGGRELAGQGGLLDDVGVLFERDEGELGDGEGGDVHGGGGEVREVREGLGVGVGGGVGGRVRVRARARAGWLALGPNPDIHDLGETMACARGNSNFMQRPELGI